ncbi:MAG: NUDIX domain-containing protein [Chitinophagales bacterium]
MAKKSAGILLYHFRDAVLEVFLIHPGGPFWSKKDEWMIPKGEFEDDEIPLDAAKREFFEETGFSMSGNFIPLTSIKQAGGKMIYAYAVEGDCDALAIRSNEFELEWPPKSGQKKMFLEVDRAEWFSLEEAKKKMLTSQLPLLDELEIILSG